MCIWPEVCKFYQSMTYNKVMWGWVCSSVVQHLSSMPEAVDLISTVAKNNVINLYWKNYSV
jgi:hypothetical protein